MENQIQVVKSSVELIGNSTPLSFIDGWDFFLVVMAALVRMFFSMKYKAIKLKQNQMNFEFKQYFDAKHIIRWTGHLLTAITLLLVVPEIFLQFIGPKYFQDMAYWSFTGDFVIGYLGYDLIKLIERVTNPLFEKLIHRKI